MKAPRVSFGDQYKYSNKHDGAVPRICLLFFGTLRKLNIIKRKMRPRRVNVNVISQERIDL